MTECTLSESVAAYFEAKRLLFQDTPDFRLLDAGPLKCFHKHPNWPEVDAFYALDVSPAEAVAAIRDYQPNARHMLTVFTSAPEALTDAYQELGYAMLPNNQPFMIKSPLAMQSADEQVAVQVRQTPTTTDYWIEADGQPVCWGKSIATSKHAIYVLGMETLPAFRRRRFATAVLQRIHADAAQNGATQSVLCSTPSGFPLYLSAGYSVLAQMQAFGPKLGL